MLDHDPLSDTFTLRLSRDQALAVMDATTYYLEGTSPDTLPTTGQADGVPLDWWRLNYHGASDVWNVLIDALLPPAEHPEDWSIAVLRKALAATRAQRLDFPRAEYRRIRATLLQRLTDFRHQRDQFAN